METNATMRTDALWSGKRMDVFAENPALHLADTTSEQHPMRVAGGIPSLCK